MSMFNDCHIHLCDCTWLNVFSQAQSLLIKHKKIFECFSFFWKVLCFAKIVKIFENSVALFWQFSRGLVQSHAPVVSPHRDFFRSSLAGQWPNHKKILRILFIIWVFNFSCGSDWRLVRKWRFQSQEYSKIFVAYFSTLLQVELLIAKNT